MRGLKDIRADTIEALALLLSSDGDTTLREFLDRQTAAGTLLREARGVVKNWDWARYCKTLKVKPSLLASLEHTAALGLTADEYLAQDLERLKVDGGPKRRRRKKQEAEL